MVGLELIDDWPAKAGAARYRAAALARLCRVSLRQLERHFRQTRHCTPQGWLDELRLAKAAERVCEPGELKDICFQLGFRNYAHFSRRFRARYGQSPSRYRSVVAANPAPPAPAGSSARRDVPPRAGTERKTPPPGAASGRPGQMGGRRAREAQVADRQQMSPRGN